MPNLIVNIIRSGISKEDKLPQVEFGTLYKFVTSVGLALIVAAVVLPWILLQSTSVLLTSEESIAALPKSAGDAVERRQVLVARAQDYLPIPTFVVLAIVGLCLLVWALFKWVPSQQRSDANERIALQKNDVELEQLTRDEVDEKLQEEVIQNSPVPLDEAASPSAATATPADPGTTTGSSGSPPSSSITPDAAQKPERPSDTLRHSGQKATEDPPERSRRLIAQLRATEDQVVRLFQESFGGAFKVEREMKITSGTARGRVLDLLLDPANESRAQLGVEIKRFGSHVMPDRLSEFLTRVAITTQDLSADTVFTGARGRPREAKASGILVLVLNSETFAANAFAFSVMFRPSIR